MICFRDKTFCDFYKECQDGKDCDRALTFGVRVKAWLWWNTGRAVGAQEPPIATYIEKPDCFKEKKDTELNNYPDCHGLANCPCYNVREEDKCEWESSCIKKYNSLL